MKNRLLSLMMAMAMAMAFTMMPVMNRTAYAAGHDSINLVNEDGVVSGISGSQISSIYFGKYRQKKNGTGYFMTYDPIKWRVLDLDHDTGTLFLLSDQILDCKKYNDTYNASTTWESSTIRSWLNGYFFEKAFSDQERKAISRTAVINNDIPPSSTGNDTNDQVFLLSVSESMNVNYGFTDDDKSTYTRRAVNTEFAMREGAASFDDSTGTKVRIDDCGNGFWWLRTLKEGNGGLLGSTVEYDGITGGLHGITQDYIGVRPAIKLDLSSAVMTSAAEGGKSSVVGTDALEQTETVSETAGWKLTLKDEAHNNFKVDTVTTTCDGKTVYIKYSGASAGWRDYISAIIKSSSGAIKYYGKLAQASSVNDNSVSVNIDGMMSDGDTLCIFNEQCNGDYETDFSSPLQEVTIQPELHDWKAATCIEPKTCKKCGATSGDPHGHSFGEWHQIKAPDCASHGGEERTCSICGYTEAQNIDPNGHEWEDDYTIDKHPTCTEDGSKSIHCRHCDAVEYSTIIVPDPDAHEWNAGEVTKEPTTAEEGVRTYTCMACGVTKTEKIDRLAGKDNTLRVKGRTAAVRYSRLKKKNQTLAVGKVISFKNKGQGRKSYKLTSVKKGKKSFRNKFSINAKTGKVTVKKGLKRGTYRVRAKVRAAGNTKYKASAWKTVTFTVKVK